MSRRSASTMLQAYDVLISQPATANGLSSAERDAIVISAIVNEAGETLVLSRFGDSQWDLRPFFEQANVSHSYKFINWDMSMPRALIDDSKAVAYAWFKRGIPGSKPPIARGITTFAVASVMPFIRWLNNLGVSSFAEIVPIHISNYVHYCKSELRLKPLPLYGRLRIIDFLWLFSTDTMFPLKSYPWGSSTLWRICGIANVKGLDAANKGVGKTDIIPPDEQSKIFNHCEKIVQDMKAELASSGVGYHPSDEQRSIRCRDAVLYIVSITSGMRNDEAIGIEVGAWRKELKNGVTFYWVATIEHKTGKGRVEYLVPELTFEALSLLAKYSAPIRKELEQEIRLLEKNKNFLNSTEHILRLEKARKDSNKLFLGRNSQGGKIKEGYHVEALSGQGSNIAFGRLAKAAGSDWPLKTHQCRRT